MLELDSTRGCGTRGWGGWECGGNLCTMPPFARRALEARTEGRATPILPAAAAATRPVGAATGELSVVAMERSIVGALNESRDMAKRIDRGTVWRARA